MTTLLDQLSAKVHQLADQLDGYKVEIVGGSIMMSPVRPVHGKTIVRLWTELEPQLNPEWALVTDVASPIAIADSELCPDLALIPEIEAAKNLSKFAPDLMELAIEVVSPGSVRRDYHEKARLYAQVAIPVYAIFDPYAALCTVHHAPDGAGYTRTERVAYGERVTLPSALGELGVDTATLPIDPGTRTDP
ncbi:Uma2 family endonuclease [Spiractinospora alimapuensis]|uniref:Uma2 family endonuclease n=1 Tax=Spiractinospora alimapuensis TaxID=2820884 RepID=UPI001F1E15CC|nr:Uma2 family endonuclease [Spiractinospora alimapuensis]